MLSNHRVPSSLLELLLSRGGNAQVEAEPRNVSCESLHLSWELETPPPHPVSSAEGSWVVSCFNPTAGEISAFCFSEFLSRAIHVLDMGFFWLKESPCACVSPDPEKARSKVTSHERACLTFLRPHALLVVTHGASTTDSLCWVHPRPCLGPPEVQHRKSGQ